MSTTSSYLILALAMYPDYQQQAFEEIRNIFPEQSSHVTAQDIAKLNFVNRFVKEVLRLFPTVPYFPRQVRNDIKIGIYSIYINSIILYKEMFFIFNIFHPRKYFVPKGSAFNYKFI